MDNYRARQIVESHGVTMVLHQGRPIWIEELGNNEARVKYLDSGKREMVRVEELSEP